MRRYAIWFFALFALSQLAMADELYLLAGNKFDGTVIGWREKNILFVLKGTTAEEAFEIPLESISRVILTDGTIHVPGEENWISNKEMGRDELLQLGLIKGAPVATENNDAAQKDSRPIQPKTKISGKLKNFDLEGYCDFISGYTEYHIKFPEGYISWESRLAFPVGGSRLGARATLFRYPFKSPNEILGIEVSYAKHLSDPAEAMVDSDYALITAYNYNDKWVWSATESSSEISSNEFTGKVKFTKYYPTNGVSIGVAVGYRYQNYSYEIFGVKGWQQWEYGGEIVSFDLYQGVNVLDYNVSYHMPFLSATADANVTDKVRLFGDFMWYPAVSASDEDDHLLRNKKVYSDCSGSGWGFFIKGTADLWELTGGRCIYLGGSYDMAKMKTTGTQDQIFYGDDPGTTDINETGISFTGIDSQINLVQKAISIYLGIKY